MDPWITISPIYDIALSEQFHGPIEFGDSVILDICPAWISDEEMLQGFAYSHRWQLDGGAEYAFYKDYEADSLGEEDPIRPGENKRSKQEVALESIILANTSLWLSKPNPATCQTYIHAIKDAEVYCHIQSAAMPGLVHHISDRHNLLSLDDLERASNLHKAILELPRKGVIWIATVMLGKMLTSKDWDIRYILIWVALETLFGPEDGREITYRISQRISFFLSNDVEEAKIKFDIAKMNYSWRSKVIHGLKIDKLSKEKSTDILKTSEKLLRASLLKLYDNFVSAK